MESEAAQVVRSRQNSKEAQGVALLLSGMLGWTWSWSLEITPLSATVQVFSTKTAEITPHALKTYIHLWGWLWHLENLRTKGAPQNSPNLMTKACA